VKPEATTILRCGEEARNSRIRGKAEVENYGFRGRGGELLARGGGAAGGGDLMAVMFEDALAKIQGIGVVVHEEDAGH
jgi:hypothetical protein